MAGNLVKWWKHKILGGYKQFSVQECTTDSEELMYHQVRASSSCSAPPDLLLVSDRENNIPLRSPVVNIIGATTAPATTTTSPSSGINACHITSATNNNQRHNQKLLHHHQQQQQQQQLQQQQQQHHHVTTQQLSQAYNGTKDIGGNGKHQKQSGGIGSSHNKHGQQQDCQQQTTTSHDIEGQMETQLNNHSSTRHAHHTHQQQQRSEEHIRLEEFTCDVSVEGGKSSQPLQFSFTFYDLDGHHGKITKDDIVGIVYTIYESIGKSVVVPHSGSKTINVRLTVSPEGKTKAAKNKKTSSNALVADAIQQQKSAPVASVSHAARRLHRYRPRKLIKSDEEDDDSNSDKDRENTQVASSNLAQVLAHKSNSKSHKLHKLKQCCSPQSSLPPNVTEIPNSPLETIYDNLKTATATTPEACRECLAAVDESRNAAISPTVQYPASRTSNTNEAYMKHVASTRIKMLRKSRKQKHQECMEFRQRSLSVGNETCLKNRHLQKQPTQQQLIWQAEQQLNKGGGGDTVDGVQLRNPIKVGKSLAGASKRNSAECWKTALNRNDLISIIRESMEKNRLCFQLNGKPQANVSPIRHSLPPTQQTQHQQQHLLQQQHNSSSSKHSQQLQTSAATISQQQHRQRSNTVSKIPTLIANHNNTHSASPHQTYYPSGQHRSSSCANTISNNSNSNNNHSQHDTILNEHHNSTNSSNNIYHHLQPHIPIYHQQMAINPAVIAAHNALLSAGSGGAGHHGKMNLCGYDSFLHATICGGSMSHSPPPQSSLANQVTSTPAVSSGQQIATVQPIMSNNTQNTTKHLSLAVTPNQIKTSKILRSGSYAQTHHQQQQQHTQVQNNTTQNSPQYHGYQRLPSSSKHNLSALHLVSPSMDKPPLDQLDKWRRDQVKNYDQLLCAKLSEKLQQTNLVSSISNARESNQRRKHRILRQRRANAQVAEANNVTLNSKINVKEDNDYAAIIHIDGDPVECENLLGQTSDEESHSQHESPVQCPEELVNDSVSTIQVAEGNLLDLDDMDDDILEQIPTQGKLDINADTLLSVDSEVHQLHLNDGLEIEEDIEEGLEGDEDLEEIVDVAENGRNSAASNDSNNAGATLANTNVANTSTTSASLIHRYVHEHIHHHYHHFEEKEE